MASEALETIKEILSDVPSTVGLIAGLTVFTGIFCYSIWRCVFLWVGGRKWWPRAKPLQAALLQNFGYTEDSLDDHMLQLGYAFVAMTVVHHAIAGGLLFPAAVFGWAETGAVGQLCFYCGILFELSFDIWDTLRQVILMLKPDWFSWMRPGPPAFFIITVVCHHQLAIFMIMPMIQYYPESQEFHRISCALVSAAAVSYATGSYKFSLDTSVQCDLCQYKLIALFQLIIIWYTRVYVWFTEAYSLLTQLEGVFFYGACFCCVLMCLFNVAIVMDATTAAIKWLPASLTTLEENKPEFEASKSATSLSLLARSGSNLQARDVKVELNQQP